MMQGAHKNHHMSQMWYIAGYLPILRGKTAAEVAGIARQCSELSQHDPLNLVTKETYQVRGWESRHGLTGSQVIALLTSCVWLMAGDSVEAGGAMFGEFPWLKKRIVTGGSEGGGTDMSVIHGWTLLRTQQDYQAWHDERQYHYGEPPASYPAYVRDLIAADEEGYYDYLYPAQLADLCEGLLPFLPGAALSLVGTDYNPLDPASGLKGL